MVAIVRDVKGYAGGYIDHLSTGLQVIHTIHNLHHNDAAMHQKKTLCTIMKYKSWLIYSGIENNSITIQSILAVAWIMHSVSPLGEISNIKSGVIHNDTIHNGTDVQRGTGNCL